MYAGSIPTLASIFLTRSFDLSCIFHDWLRRTFRLDTKNKHGAALPVIGWREWAGLPDLGIPRIKAKVDTGARTSTLHAFRLNTWTDDDGSEWVSFDMHPMQRDSEQVVRCHAPVKDRRIVRDSGGHETERVVIDTTVVIGEESFTAEVTLTERDNMLFRMLLGRTAMNGRFLVNPQKSYLIGKRKRKPQQ